MKATRKTAGKGGIHAPTSLRASLVEFKPARKLLRKVTSGIGEGNWIPQNAEQIHSKGYSPSYPRHFE
jgi:hypothetical protein